LDDDDNHRHIDCATFGYPLPDAIRAGKGKPRKDSGSRAGESDKVSSPLHIAATHLLMNATSLGVHPSSHTRFFALILDRHVTKNKTNEKHKPLAGLPAFILLWRVPPVVVDAGILYLMAIEPCREAFINRFDSEFAGAIDSTTAIHYGGSVTTVPTLVSTEWEHPIFDSNVNTSATPTTADVIWPVIVDD
jgi:hypothetical protein